MSSSARGFTSWGAGSVAAVVVCTAIGAALASSPHVRYLAIAVAVIPMLVGIAFAADHTTRVRFAVAGAWLGLLAPIAAVQPASSAQIQSTSITPIAAADSAVMVGMIVLAVLLVKPSFSPVGIERYLGAYLAVDLASTAWSSYPTATALKGGQLVGAYAALVIIIRCTPPRVALRQLAGVVHLAVCSVLLGAAIAPHRAFALTGLPGDNVPRLQGVFPAVQFDFVGLLACASVFFVSTRVGPRWAESRAIRGGLIAADLAALVLARARTSVVELVVGLVVIQVVSEKRRRRLAILAPVTAAVAIAGYLIAAATVGAWVARGQNSQQLASLTGRTTNWRLALSVWRHHPLQGFGFYTGHRLGEVAAVLGVSLQNLDNTWVETLVDVGVLGAVPLALFVLAGVARGWRIRNDSDGAAVCAVCSAAVVSSFVNPTFQRPCYALVVFGITLIVADRLAAARSASEPSFGNAGAGVCDSHSVDYPDVGAGTV